MSLIRVFWKGSYRLTTSRLVHRVGGAKATGIIQTTTWALGHANPAIGCELQVAAVPYQPRFRPLVLDAWTRPTGCSLAVDEDYIALISSLELGLACIMAVRCQSSSKFGTTSREEGGFQLLCTSCNTRWCGSAVMLNEGRHCPSLSSGPFCRYPPFISDLDLGPVGISERRKEAKRKLHEPR